MIRYILVSVCLSVLFGAFSQESKNDSIKVYDMHLKGKVKGLLKVKVKDSLIFEDYRNLIRVKPAPGYKLGQVEIKGGTFKKIKGGLEIRTNRGVSQLFLKLYAIDASNRSRVGYTEVYKVYPLEKPKLRVGGVPADSIIKRSDLLKNGIVTATVTRFGNTQLLKVEGFEFFIQPAPNKISHYKSKSNRLSPEMREAIKRLPPGAPLYFTNAICVALDGIKLKSGLARIFLDTSPVLNSVRPD